MRNLKKFLALVLAFMMTMSLMVTVDASNVVKAPDAEGVTPAFEEAIDVLMGMGIIRGGDDGKINPKDPIRRGEMAAMIYRLYSGDVAAAQEFLYAETGTAFSDVQSGQWYSGVVGFCASYNFIAGSEGKFRPEENITGYEALVMILRAMGYDKDGEFTGNSEWKQNAHTRALTVGLLDGINSSNYQYSLIQPATREFVAALLFQAAQLPMVTYNRGFVNKYEYMNSATGTEGQTLGKWHFGLTANTGIIVGNQATGETGTKIGFTVAPAFDNAVSPTKLIGGSIDDNYNANFGGSGSAYHYEKTADSTAVGDIATTDGSKGANVTLTFLDNKATDTITKLETAKTGLDLFNHAVKVWYDERGTGVTTITADSGSASFSNNLKTYTIRDQAVTSKVVADVDSGDGDFDTGFIVGTTVENLAEVIYNAGFNVSNSANDNNLYANYAFAPMNTSNWGAKGSADIGDIGNTKVSPVLKNDTATPQGLYLVISNNVGDNGKPDADVVISLELTMTEILEDNKYQTTTSFGLLNSNDSTDAGSKVYFGSASGVLNDSDNAHDVVTIPGTSNTTYLNIARTHLLGGTDEKNLTKGDYVAAVAVTGTAGKTGAPVYDIDDYDDGNAPEIATPGIKYDLTVNDFYYQINKLEKVEIGTVLYIDGKMGVHIRRDDGSEIDIPKSVLAEATDGSFAWDTNTISVHGVTPRQRYDFYLDGEGNYLFYELHPEANTEFVYATYIDRWSDYLSGQFSYGDTHVNENGELIATIGDQTTVTKIDGTAMASSETAILDTNNLPKRVDGENKSSSSIVSGVYTGYMRKGTELTSITPSDDQDTGFYQATADNFGWGVDNAGSATNKLTIDDNASKLGALIFGNTNTSGVRDRLAVTKDTTFYFVSNVGGNTKVQKMTFAELKGRTIDATTLYANNNVATYLTTDTDIVNAAYEMVYYSIDQSNYYAQIVAGGALPIDKVFLPLACLETQSTSAADGSLLVYVGNNKDAITKNSHGKPAEEASLFNVYDAATGNKLQLWIQGYWDEAGLVSKNFSKIIFDGDFDDTFIHLAETGEKANNGWPIYKPVEVTTAQKRVIIGNYYDVDGDTAAQTNHSIEGLYTNGKFHPVYFGNMEYAGIQGADKLYNVKNAQVINLNPDRYLNVDTVPGLMYASSVEVNGGIENVSYYLSGTGVVSIIYLHYPDPV